jgi:recombinase
VRWVFAQRFAGCSVAGIARTLNARGVPAPSAHDRVRNPHRTGTAWTLRTIAAILANPRYTGRQVWKRQSVDHHETRPGDKSSRPLGRKPTRAWNPRDQWKFLRRVPIRLWSAKPTSSALRRSPRCRARRREPAPLPADWPGRLQVLRKASGRPLGAQPGPTIAADAVTPARPAPSPGDRRRCTLARITSSSKPLPIHQPDRRRICQLGGRAGSTSRPGHHDRLLAGRHHPRRARSAGRGSATPLHGRAWRQ